MLKKRYVSLKNSSLLAMVIAALFFSTVSTSIAQIKIITNAGKDSVRISWEHSWKDTSGLDENVFSFRLWTSLNDSPFVCVGETSVVGTYIIGESKPPTTYKFTNLLVNTKYIFGVTAVDLAGNESEIAKSTDSTSAYGGWYLIIDNTPPARVFSITPF